MEMIFALVGGLLVGVALAVVAVLATVQRAYRVARLYDADPEGTGRVLATEEILRSAA